ncbi:MAG: M48 family metallopeptidase [Thiotrichales bacterium]|nr:M48 family metallopeptidase [Thiotrichales bacterium]
MSRKSPKLAEPQTFTVGEHRLPIVKTHRKKSIGLKPNANHFELHVPKHLSNRALQQVLNNHIDWIQKRLQHYQTSSRLRPNRFEFKEGEPLLYLGDVFNFEPQVSQTKQRFNITLEHQAFQVSIPSIKWLDPSDVTEHVSHLNTLLTPVLSNWYKQQATTYFEKQMPFYAEQIGVKYSAIQVKSYKSRWGSCYSDGRIQFNWKLMQAPTWVIDYVIVHELCHLKHANHSPAFWNLVEIHYPRTQEAKRWLKANQHRLIGFLS